MDCGPAALASVLEGFGMPVSYGRLREACQTGVDGTSIDSLEEVAIQLGLEAEQVVIPVDHLLAPAARALPALVVVRLPSGITHFAVAWRRVGRMIQVMDPATGRRWPTARRFLSECYVHRQDVPAAAWREWAEEDEFQLALDQRLAALGVGRAPRARWRTKALAAPGWTGIASLDAATRMASALLDGRALRRAEVCQLVPALVEAAEASASVPAPVPAAAPIGAEVPSTSPPGPPSLSTGVPDRYWSVRPTDDAEILSLRGAVLVRFLGLRPPRPAHATAPDPSPGEPPSDRAAPDRAGEDRATPDLPNPGDLPLAPELAAALEERPASAARELWGLLREDGLRMPVALAAGTAVAAGIVLIEALLLRGALEIGPLLGSQIGKLGAIAAAIAFFGLLFGLQYALVDGALRLGRHLEMRLRVRVYQKIPRLPHRYFASRLVSDMAERGHSVRSVRQLPLLARELAQNASQLIFTTLGIAWLDPGSALLASLAALAFLLLPLATHPWLAERDLKVRNHAGALSRYYLDALLGLTPILSHGAERAVRREHESLLVEWRRASVDLLRVSVGVQALQALAGFGLAAWLLADHLARAGLGGGVLLLVYWALRLPELAQGVAARARQVPQVRSTMLRLMEPLTAPEDRPLQAKGGEPTAPEQEARPHEEPLHETPLHGAVGVSEGAAGSGELETPASLAPAIAMDRVGVRAGGHWLLRNVDLQIAPGEHLAVVGPSGAGKSTLVGLLLGWHPPAEGSLTIDGSPAGTELDALRRRLAWVDPAVQLWNTSLYQNLRYGRSSTGEPSAPGVASPGVAPSGPASPGLGRVLRLADLDSVLDRLPDGLGTTLGEDGGLVSGGEGQRVRFGRALHRENVGLVVLDEPFRGLDRETRRRLLDRARHCWVGSTLICVTHDVAETADFPRILVVEDGRLVEDGPPVELMARSGSAYGRLRAAEDRIRRIWHRPAWRRLWVGEGQVREDPA